MIILGKGGYCQSDGVFKIRVQQVMLGIYVLKGSVNNNQSLELAAF